MENKLPISVNICVLNEGESIRACLESVLENNPSEIIVCDGGSTDNTLSILEEYSVKVVHSKVKGLSSQRQLALDHSTQPFIAIVDGDDILDKEFLGILYDEILEYKFDALQGREIAFNPTGYCEKAMGVVNGVITHHPKPVETNMVGRPSLYRATCLKECGFDSFFDGVGDEDTDLAIRMELKGFRQGFGSGLTRRKQTNGWIGSFKKFRKYGRGDAKIVYKYPFKRTKLFYHLLIRYPIIRPFQAAVNGHIKYAPFFVFIGFIRAYYMAINYIKLQFLKPVFKKYA
jgi:glycosyltransferase involved in cell wall biosynthesis